LDCFKFLAAHARERFRRVDFFVLKLARFRIGFEVRAVSGDEFAKLFRKIDVTNNDVEITID
jgi:hypothetical protein